MFKAFKSEWRVYLCAICELKNQTFRSLSLWF